MSGERSPVEEMPHLLTQRGSRREMPPYVERPARGQLSDLHMLVLGTIMHHTSADAEEVAGWLGLPVILVETLCDELEATGRLTLARGQHAAIRPSPQPAIRPACLPARRPSVTTERLTVL